ncbi:MAG: histidine phosphatase family protein [Bacteroidota bacterium]
MKQLLLMRHAKSSWDIPGQSDFDRTLNERGKKDAPEMAHRIKQKGFQPQLMVCSPAKRTQKTAKIVAEVLGYNEKKIDLETAIYDADISDLLHVIRSLDDTQNRVMMIGHNPGFTGLIGILTNSLVENLPTAGVALIHFDIKSWKQVASQSGTLVWLDFPKNQD